MKILINLALALASIAYPLIWLWASEYHHWLQILPWLMALLWFLKGWQAVEFQQKFAFFMGVLLAVVGLTRASALMYWYPVIMNLMMLVLFGSSLWAKQTLVERLARLTEPDLPDYAVNYTRKVTWLWCGVFIFNILVTVSLILTNQLDWWAIYSGVIAYIILGCVMAAEWLVRQFVKKHYEKLNQSD